MVCFLCPHHSTYVVILFGSVLSLTRCILGHIFTPNRVQLKLTERHNTCALQYEVSYVCRRQLFPPSTSSFWHQTKDEEQHRHVTFPALDWSKHSRSQAAQLPLAGLFLEAVVTRRRYCSANVRRVVNLTDFQDLLRQLVCVVCLLDETLLSPNTPVYISSLVTVNHHRHHEVI